MTKNKLTLNYNLDLTAAAWCAILNIAYSFLLQKNFRIESGILMSFEITKVRTKLVCNTFVNEDYEAPSQNNIEDFLQLDDCLLSKGIGNYDEELRMFTQENED